MIDFPITDEAVEAADKALSEKLIAENRFLEIDEEDEKAFIHAFLAAEGFTVDRQGRFFPAKRKGIMEHRDTHHRLVGEWRRIDA